MLIDKTITKIIGGGGYGIAEVKHMEKTLWKKEPLTYVLTTLGDEKYFTERPDIAEKYPKDTEGKRVFMVNPPAFFKDSMKLWVDDNRYDFIQYYVNISAANLLLELPKADYGNPKGFMAFIPISVENGQILKGCTIINMADSGNDRSYTFDSFCIVCDAEKADTVKIGIIKEPEEDGSTEEYNKYYEDKQKIAEYFGGKYYES